MPLDNFYRMIRSIEVFDIQKETIDIINKNRFYIEGLLRLQLQSGKDGDGENVTIFGRDYYKDSTIFEKERHGIGLGKQTEFITNYMNGYFYSELQTIAEGTVFKTISNVPYFSEIIQRSGSKIMNLNKEHLIEFSKEILIPELKRRFKDIKNGL